MKHELIDHGNHVIRYAEKAGASQVEAYLESSRIINVKIEKGLIRLAADNHDVGCGIRVTFGNQLGVSYVTSVTKDDIERATQDAIKAAKAAVPDSDFKSFASIKSSYPVVRGIFDKEIDELECEHAVEFVMQAKNASLEVSGSERNLIEGELKAESKTISIINSHGISGSSSSTKVELSISSTIGVSDNQCSSWEDQSSRFLTYIDPEKIGNQSAKNALYLRRAKSMEGGDMPLILSPRALSFVLGKGLVPALDGKQVQDGNSYLIDSIGSQVASPELDILDDGIMQEALGSRPFDAEGVPSQQTPLIEAGILKGYLHNSYSSSRGLVDNTGNAGRSSYRVVPKIEASNLVVSSGNATLDDMLSAVKKGVFCTFTFDRPNFVTGELSAMIMEGFLIEKGEIQHALKNTLFGVRMQDLLNRITMIGSEVEQRQNVITPHILIDSVKITSG